MPLASREAASSSRSAGDIISGSNGLARRSVGGFDIFSLLASHHDPDLVVRGGRLTTLAQ
jgi:hypothetical protein